MGKITIEMINQIAIDRGGILLSKEYLGCFEKLKFLCNKGHEFEIDPVHLIHHKQWCKYCISPKGEKLCRLIFETIFDTKFKKLRPIWLINKNNNRLELDGFNEELKLAFEYNGRQHYKITDYSNEEKLKTIQEHDDIKKIICNKMNIKLIQVPEFNRYYNIEKCIDVIYNSLNESKIVIPKEKDEINIDYNLIYRQPIDQEYLDIIATKGGKCLSKYGTGKQKVLIECALEHQWEISLANIKYGYWCPYCAKNIKLTIENMQKIAEKYDGKCLSTEYINTTSHLFWQCKFGHIWESTAANIKRGHWCQKCNCYNNKNKTITDAQIVAQYFGGECLSTNFINNKFNLTWQCKCGYIWNESYQNIVKNEQWHCQC